MYWFLCPGVLAKESLRKGCLVRYKINLKLEFECNLFRENVQFNSWLLLVLGMDYEHAGCLLFCFVF